MSNYELRKHKTADAVKWVIVFMLILGLVATTVTLFVKLDRQTTVTEIGAEAYVIGTLDDKGVEKEGDTSIVTRNGINVDGFNVSIADDATITYALYFYDADGEFVSKTDNLSVDFVSSELPKNADTVKILITPTDDEQITLTEVIGYVGQLTVTINR